ASFFLAAFYADAMLALGVLGAVHHALAGRVWWSVPFLALATASKVLGVAAVAVVAVIVFVHWRRDTQPIGTLLRRWAITVLGLSGLVSYMVYLWVRFGD